jgi:peptide deformylase
MILTIRKIGDPILEKPCREIKNPLKHKRLIKDMFETAKFYNAAGLAANQVGQSVQIFLLTDSMGGYHIIINPKIDVVDKTTFANEEACLSVPKIGAIVRRYNQIKIYYLDINGDSIERILEGFEARVALHEAEHLSGKLMLENAEKIFYMKIIYGGVNHKAIEIPQGWICIIKGKPKEKDQYFNFYNHRFEDISTNHQKFYWHYLLCKLGSNS